MDKQSFQHSALTKHGALTTALASHMHSKSCEAEGRKSHLIDSQDLALEIQEIIHLPLITSPFPQCEWRPTDECVIALYEIRSLMALVQWGVFFSECCCWLAASQWMKHVQSRKS